MNETVRRFIERFQARRRMQMRLLAGFLALALVASTGTYWWLHDTAVAETDIEDVGTEYTLALEADPMADVETSTEWEATLPETTGEMADDIVAAAISQIGYTESSVNYKESDDGLTRLGYTRYGDWYGNEYGSWDAIFVDFILSHAGGDALADYPTNSGAYALAAALKDSEYFAAAEDYEPQAGDLVFFDTDEDGRIDHVGLVAVVEDGSIIAIEGDVQITDDALTAEEVEEAYLAAQAALEDAAAKDALTEDGEEEALAEDAGEDEDAALTEDDTPDTDSEDVSSDIDDADAEDADAPADDAAPALGETDIAEVGDAVPIARLSLKNISDFLGNVTSVSASEANEDLYELLDAATTDDDGALAAPADADDAAAAVDDAADTLGEVGDDAAPSEADEALDVDEDEDAAVSDMEDADNDEDDADAADADTADTDAADAADASAYDADPDGVAAYIYALDDDVNGIVGYGLLPAATDGEDADADTDSEINTDVADADGDAEDGDENQNEDEYGIAVANDIALADTPTGTAISGDVSSSLQSGGTYYLSGDSYCGSEIDISANTTLNLNGNKLVYTGSGELFKVNSGKLTIKNSGTANTVDSENVTTVANGASDGTNLYGNTATLNVSLNGSSSSVTKLVYYVTTSTPDSSDTTKTTETLVKYTVTPSAYIMASQDCWQLVDVEGGSFDLEGGMLSCSNCSVSHVIYNKSGTTVTIKGTDTYVCGGKSENNDNPGGAIYSDGTLNIEDGAVIAANSAPNGGGVCASSTCTFTLDGGIISGNTSNAWTDIEYGNGDKGGGGVLSNGATCYIKSGYITNNVKKENDENKNGNSLYGGGGMATDGGSLEMTGGYVTGNSSEEAGGGLYVGFYWTRGEGATKFTMTGGTVASNYAANGEGGGIRISGTNDTINKTATIGTATSNLSETQKENVSTVYITNNYLADNHDWGGGGVFVQTSGVLTVYNSVLTNNTADGYGGGFAACPTGISILAAKDGAALYNNSANGSSKSGGTSGGGEVEKSDDSDTVGDGTTYGSHVDGNFNTYQDYYCVYAKGGYDLNDDGSVKYNGNDPVTNDKLISLVFGEMLGGGSANWTVRSDGTTTTGVRKGNYFTGQWLVGATAVDVSSEDKDAAVAAANVYISGNYSAVHGGGIMTNGSVTFGVPADSAVSASLDVTGTKVVTLNGNTESSSEYTYTNAFEFLLLSFSGGPTITNGVISYTEDNIVGTATTDTSGKFDITLDATHDLSDIGDLTGGGNKEVGTGDETYYLVEKTGTAENISYDTTIYKLVISMSEQDKTYTLEAENSSSSQTVEFTVYTVTGAKVYKYNSGSDGNYDLLVSLDTTSDSVTKTDSGWSTTLNNITLTIGVNNESIDISFADDSPAFTNPVKTYTLPSSGGVGTDGFTLVGLAVVMVAGIALLLLYRKRERSYGY